MKLELASLRLVGCGPFDDVTLNFCDADGKPKKTILLAGANGSGKTTVLEAIVDTFQMNLFPQPLDKLRGSAMLRLHLQSNRHSHWRHSTISYGVAFHGFAMDRFAQEFFSVMRADLVEENRSDYPPTIAYFPHPRQLHRVEATSLHKEEYRYTPIYRHRDSDGFPGSLSSYLIWLEYADSTEYQAVVAFLESLDISAKKFEIDRKQLEVIVTTADGHKHPLAEMSSGEQNLFILLLEMRRRLTKGSVVLIDEVEGSLHPAFQFKLLYALEKLQEEFDLQLILTTHSRDVFEAVGAENTLILTDYTK